MLSIESDNFLYNAEDTDYKARCLISQLVFHKRIKVPDWLAQAESPFTWLRSLNVNFTTNISSVLIDKLKDYTNQGPDYGFEKYIIHLTLLVCRPLQLSDMYDVQRKRNESSDQVASDSELSDEDEEESSSGSEDEHYLIDPEKYYRDLQASVEEMKARQGDVMYVRVGTALEHVMFAARAHMLYLMGKEEESLEISKSIPPAEDFNSECKAGILGIKAKFISWLYQDMDVALKESKKSIELDPDFGYWHYSTGKITRRQRRDRRQYIELPELEYFEKAVALEKNPKFLVFLAQAYQEMGFTTKHDMKSENRFHVCERMFEKSTQLYRECWKLKNDSAAIARRVGNGMMKMKGEHFDHDLAKLALHRATELSPNEVTYHALGKLYLHFEYDEEKAVKYFTAIEPGIFGTGELIRYKLIKDIDSDLDELIKKLIEHAEHQVKKDFMHCDIGWYYLYMKHDIYKAVNFFWRVLKRERNLPRLLEFTSYAFVVRSPINALRILLNEVLLFVDYHLNRPEGPGDVEILKSFLEKVFEKFPEFQEVTPDPDMLPSVKQEIDRNLAQMRKRYWFARKTYEDKKKYSGNWRQTDKAADALKDKENVKSDSVRNWRSEGKPDEQNTRTEVDNGDTRSQPLWGRRRCVSGEHGESNKELDKSNRPRRQSEREQNSGRGGQSNWNERYETYNQQNIRGEGSERRFAAEHRGNRYPGQGRERPRQQSYNNRYDTTVTNWRTENRD